jgi:antirestriction protein
LEEQERFANGADILEISRKANEMKIYITDLEAYNNGHLVGAWLELPMDQDTLAEAMEEVLYRGRNECNHQNHHEEVFITDYEAEITISEYDDIYRLNELAEHLESISKDDLLKLKLLSHEGYNEREVLIKGLNEYEVDIHDYSADTSFTDVYELLAYDFVADGLFGKVPAHLENYLDYSAIARDLSAEYTEFEHAILGRVA